MATKSLDVIRKHLVRALDWEDAHVGFDAAVRKVPAALRAKRPRGFPHSPWELLERLRLAQRDRLDFCVNPDYVEGKFPDDYWPESARPQGDGRPQRALSAPRGRFPNPL